MKISVVDLETTGTEPDEGAKVCELAGVDLTEDLTGIQGHWGSLIQPHIPMPPEAQAVHHISDGMLVGAPDLEVYMGQVPALVEGVVLVAHNAQFEHKFLKGPLAGMGHTPIPRFICTMRMSQHLWPEAPGKGNQTLRYWRKLAVEPISDLPPHRALPDAVVTAALFLDILATSGMTVAEIIEAQHKPILLEKMPFGKHKKMQMDQLPRSYYRWVLFKSDIDDKDILHTIRHHYDNGAGTND